MSERAKAYIVTLDADVYVDEGTYVSIATALRMVKGVVSVEPVPLDIDDFANRERIRSEYRRKVLEALQP